MTDNTASPLITVEEAIAQIAEGRIVIVVDDEGFAETAGECEHVQPPC